MLDDQQLLRRYASDGSDAAFGELVARYVNLVYSAALRRASGDTHLAQDAAQVVFTDLARKACSLPKDVVLAGWLHKATRYAVTQMLRREHRRQTREQEAVAMNELKSESTLDWEQIRLLLDEALDRLNQTDRDALLLRFFEQRSLAEVGRALGSNEEAARKRVARALEKLRTDLIRRGVAITPAALSTALSVNAIQIAPAGLTATLASASLAGAAAANGTTLIFLRFMAATKLELGIISAIIVASLVTPLVSKHQAQTRLQQANESLQHQADQLTRLLAENERLSSLAAQARSPNQLGDLLKLRGEVGLLRKQTNDLATLQEENRRLRAQNSQQSNRPKTPLQLKEEGFAKMTYAKHWVLAFIRYADKNQGQFPKTFDQAASFLPGEAKAETNMTTNQFEIVYQGSWDTALNVNKVIVLREKQAQQWPDGKWSKAYGFADGHSELHTEADGNFGAFEKSRLITLPHP